MTYLLVFIATIAGFVYFVRRGILAAKFSYAGQGEREARAAYAKLQRESPDAPDAKASEAEFVERYVRKGPKVWPNYLFALGTIMAGGVLMILVAVMSS